MCGIAGLIDCGSRDVLERMVATLAHRGPDDAGVQWFVERRSGIGHRRLSILDLSSAGHQPMVDARGTRWITYNGEVYNFLELRRELEGHGHRFQSRTDTEVILAAYDQWGADAVARLEGMFAFAIYDVESGDLFLARDHVGIKPLYYWHSGDSFAFASEAKALFELDAIERRVDPDAIISTLMLLWVPEPKTGFRDICKLEPGHYARFRNGRLELTQYWDLPYGESQAGRGRLAEAERIEELRSILERVVRRQMIADVPVASLLSGGLDSSLVTALMRKVSGGSISTYTIAFTAGDRKMEGMPDDARYARLVARHLETEHHEIVVEPAINDLMPRLLWHMDDPVADGAAINTYLISKGAREAGTVVLLSGMGADEIFGGYRKHLATLLMSRYQRIPGFLRHGMIEPLVRRMPVAIGGHGLVPVRWARRFVRSASLSPLESFIRGFGYFSPEDLAALMRERFDPSTIDESYPVRRYHELADRVRGLPIMDQMTYLDTKLFLPGLNLEYTDKSSMAASVEMRPPLIDRELVEFAMRLPGDMKIKGRTQKYLLKRAAASYLPREVIDRPKAAFGTPIRAWMRHGLADTMRRLLSSPASAFSDYLDPSLGLTLLDAHIAGREDNAHRLWGLLVLAEWLELQRRSNGAHRMSGQEEVVSS